MSGHNDAGSEPLYDMKDVKIEVMRARGAGGQVCTMRLVQVLSVNENLS